MCDHCGEEHSEMLEKITRIDQAIEFHVSEVHEKLSSVTHAQSSDIEAMARILVGPKKDEILGGGRDESLGLGSIVRANRESIRRLETQAANGGFRAKLSKAQASAIYAAGIAGISSIIVALVS